MDKMLLDFLNTTNEVHKKNCLIEQEKDIERQKEKEKKEKEMTKEPEGQLPIDKSSPSVQRILELGFTINAYKQEEHPYLRKEMLDVFYCSYNGWIFEVDWSWDPDIEGGILALRNPKHLETGRELNFYCDLFCNNTAEIRLEKILSVFREGYEVFMEKEYGEFLSLPKKLRDRGLRAEIVDYSFEINGAKGYIDLGDNVYLKFYRTWWDDIKLVVTNDKKWDVNSSNTSFGKDAIGYYFDYRNEDDVEELVKCIEALKEHVQGKIGYKEVVLDENGEQKEVYYTGEDFEGVFRGFIKQIKKKDYEKWNHRIVQYDVEKEWDERGYEEDVSYPNKYVGYEIHKNILFSLNEAAQWTVGNQSVFYQFTLNYDKRVDADNCHLTISQWVCEKGERIWFEHEDTETANKELDSYKGTFTKKGTYTEIENTVRSFLRENLTAMDVQL